MNCSPHHCEQLLAIMYTYKFYGLDPQDSKWTAFSSSFWSPILTSHSWCYITFENSVRCWGRGGLPLERGTSRNPCSGMQANKTSFHSQKGEELNPSLYKHNYWKSTSISSNEQILNINRRTLEISEKIDIRLWQQSKIKMLFLFYRDKYKGMWV